MFDILKSTRQHIEHISLEECVPTNYQRTTNDRQVAGIAENFDEAKLGVLTVSLRDGKYHIIDGLHRSKALKQLGYTHALCAVLTGLTYEQEADYFRKQNQNKRVITTFDDFRAGLEAMDETCVRINEIASTYNFQISKGIGFFRIASIKALLYIVNEYGYDTLNNTLRLIAETWSGIPKASRCESLLGVAEFVNRYGILDFTERLRDKFSVIYYDYTEAMRVRGSAGSATSRMKFCRVLVAHYNQGLRTNSKKRLKWGA